MQARYLVLSVCAGKVFGTICLCRQGIWYYLFVQARYLVVSVCTDKVFGSICLYRQGI